MDLAAVGQASINMHLAQTQQSVSIAVLKMGMELMEVQTGSMVNSIQQAASFGHQLDILV